MASGGNDINNIDTSPPQEAYVIYGAVIGGPAKSDLFWDIRSDWPQTEVGGSRPRSAFIPLKHASTGRARLQCTHAYACGDARSQ